MKRKIYNYLKNWKESSNGKSAILIDGARRVGKSWIAEEFARNEYDSYIIIDFNNPAEGMMDLLDRGFSNLDTLFSELSLLTDTKLYPRKSVIVFDEVQLYPKARAAIKYLVKDGRYDYIETGSLVSINHNVERILIPSEERRIDMFPMDFEEFLWACDQIDLWNYIRQCHADKKPLGNALHRKAMQLLRSYLLVGGMPQSVLKYVESRDFREIDNIKRDIIALYRNDISKYAGRQAPKVTRLFDNIPGALKQPSKRLRPSKLKAGGRMRDFEDAIFWLDESRVVNFCYSSSEPNVGLALTAEDTKLKAYLGDTGLLLSMGFTAEKLVADGIYHKILLDKPEFNKGMIIENFVAQQLRATGHPLFYYHNSTDRTEIDFLIVKDSVTSRHNIIPIEVKSTTRYTTLSLDKFRKKFDKYIDSSVIIHSGDLEITDGILHLPLYMTGLL